MTLELKVSEFSIRKVGKICLGMRGYKRNKIHFLSEQVKEKKLLRSEGELGRHATSGLENFLLSDEKFFTIHEVSNSLNDRIVSLTTCSNKEMLRYVPKLQKPPSVMIWPGISASGRTHRVFVPSGVKINVPAYCSLILDRL